MHVNRVLSGFAYSEGEEVLFNTFRFSVEGIDEWVGISGIKVDPQLENRTLTITYQLPEEISFNLKNGMQLLITFSYTLPGHPYMREAKITQKTYFKLTSGEKKDLKDFIAVAHKITNLLCFAIDQTVCLDDVSATSDDIQQVISDSKSLSKPIKTYYPSLPFSKEEPKISWHTMLFRFEHIRKHAEKIFNNWFDAYNEIEPALNLYFSTKTGGQKYLDGRFLALAQGLETYHRRTSDEKFMDDDEFSKLVAIIVSECPEEKKDWLQGRLIHGNEINFGNRIKKIIEPFKKHVGSSRDRNKIIRSIVDTRNYLTHYDKSLKNKTASGNDLLTLYFKMEAFFQLHFLQILGFNQKEIKSVLDNCPQLKKKLN